MALKGIRRALEVLALIAERPMRASEIAEAAGVPWATMHRTLTELEKGGFLRREADTGRYVIGQALWSIGSAYLASHPVYARAIPYLTEAVQKSQSVVQLCERVGRNAVALFTQAAPANLLPMTTLGTAIPLHAGSKGQVLLAFADPDVVDWYLAGPLPRLTEATIVDPHRLRERLAEIRARGHVFTRGDVQTFTQSVAAPVFDADGRVFASVSFIEMISETGGEDRMARQTELVVRVAGSISSMLGYRPETGWAVRPAH